MNYNNQSVRFVWLLNTSEKLLRNDTLESIHSMEAIMSEKTSKQDRRTRYTRQTIKETFLELLKQKNFTKITVTELCKISEINRGTFYLHYYDIHDVLEDILNDIAQDMKTTVEHYFAQTRKAVPIPSAKRFIQKQNTALCFWMIQLLPFFWKK